MNVDDLRILKAILRKPIANNYRDKNLITLDWQFSDDGTVQVYAGEPKLWYYLNKELIFTSDYDENDLFNLNEL